MKEKEEQQNNNVENLKDNSNTWGGARPNAGRPKGSENEETKKKRVVEEEFRQRVLKSANKLINSQMNLAEGVQMLYCIEKDEKGNNKKPRLVTSQQEIEDYLADELDGGDYYFITTERPDNRALDSLFDRVFGKSVGNLDITSKGEKVEAFNFVSNNKDDSRPKTDNKTGGSLEETTG